MSSHRVLLLEGPLRLSIDTGRLVLQSREKPDTFVQPADIAVLVIDHPNITITSAVLKSLAAENCVVLISNDRHLPLAASIPLSAPTRAGRRLRQQLALEASPQAGCLWRDLVTRRILTQSRVLRDLGRTGSLYLERLAAKVGPGDKSNHEAQAAKHYWKHLWPSDFRREKQGADDRINSRLNYGYAILRSMVARSLVAAGLQPIIGLGHRGEENPLNLADDFMEPYRFVVEQHVTEILQAAPDAPFDANGRKEVAKCVTRDVVLAGQIYRLPAAVEESVQSFTRLLEAADAARFVLVLPEALA